MSTSNESPSSRELHFEILIELEGSGGLDALVRGGVISTTTLQFYEIAKRMERELRRRRFTPRMTIVDEVAEEFKVKRWTVYRAMKLFNVI